MSAYTSVAAGNWSNPSIWSPEGVPGIGDTVTISHAVTVDVDTTIGTSPAANTVVVQTTSGGRLTIADNTLFRVRGDFGMVNPSSGVANILTLGPGSHYQFDASENPAERYQIKPTAANQMNIRIYAHGTPSNPARFSSYKPNGTEANGRMDTGGTTLVQRYDFENVLLEDLGESDTYPAIEIYTNYQAEFVNCTFRRCGPVFWKVNASTTGTFRFNGLKFYDSLWSYCLHLTSNGNPTTGVREVIGCYLDKGIGSASGSNVQGWNITDNVLGRFFAFTGAPAKFERNVILRIAAGSFNFFGDMKDCVLVYDRTISNPHTVELAASTDQVIDGVIFDPYEQTGDTGEVFMTKGSADQLRTVKNCLILPQSNNPDAGAGSAMVWIVPSSNSPRVKVLHNTIVGNVCGLQVAENSATPANRVEEYKSNLLWNTAPGNGNHVLHLAYVPSDDIIVADGCTHNCIHNGQLMSSHKPSSWDYSTSWDTFYSTRTTTGTPGANDVNVAPMFVDPTRNVAKFGSTVLGADGTVDGTLTALSDSPSTLIPQMIDWIRAGFAPQNEALKGAAHDGGDIGAVAVSTEAPAPVNSAPVVSAGEPRSITLPSTVTLIGTASDDGLPGSGLTFQWSKVSGPGSVVFGAPTALTTTASFSTAGTYVLRLAVNDGELQNTSAVTITVHPAPTAEPNPGSAAVVDSGTVTLSPAPHLPASVFTTVLAKPLEDITVRELAMLRDALNRVPGGGNPASVVGALLQVEGSGAVVTGSSVVDRAPAGHLSADVLTTLLATPVEDMTVGQVNLILDALSRVPRGSAPHNEVDHFE